MDIRVPRSSYLCEVCEDRPVQEDSHLCGFCKDICYSCEDLDAEEDGLCHYCAKEAWEQGKVDQQLGNILDK